MYKQDYIYASTRLVSTIVRYKRKVVLVNDVFSSGICGLTEIGSGKRYNIHLDELNVKPLRLGYINSGGKVYYIVRKPMREDWRQGTRANNIICIANGQPWGNFDRRFSNMVDNRYPNYSKCVCSTSVEIAWCREWAIVKSHNKLMYKGFVVGVYEDGEVKLHLSKAYLQERLDASLR